MKRPTLALALLLIAPLAAAAQPGPPPGGPPPHGAQATDSQPLAPPRMFLSPSGQPFRPTPSGGDPFDAWFAQADANHDGRIDRAEFRADAEAFFKQLDANGDGRIDGFEINAYEHRIAPELASEVESRAFGPPPGSGRDDRDGGKGRGGKRGGPGGDRDAGGREGDGPGGGGRGGAPGGLGRGHVSLLNEPEPVSGADFDLDGRVTAAEWLRATDRRFDMLDDKRLGYLTRDALFAKLPKPPAPKKGRR
jgi:hypothetical protein